MMNGFEDFQKFGKDNMDVMMQSFGAMTKGMQAIASEVADYQKKSFEDGSAALEKLVSAKSLDKAFEAQSEYVKGAYESFVGEATKIGEMYSEIAKESYKSYEGALSKAAK
ncbi:phasin family protein [Stappia sp.]|uniref:phasin family protein n=1 Tax=Stappia sp. TaxID=1870903 RepID=UPI003A98E1C5